ncbi:MAG TPA: HAMP domain-containing sensor histidine kinase, partial [Terriglobia bacterium]|nr:HAMP domain-containing sensor histidine kinase [Terriglobia bacterium]
RFYAQVPHHPNAARVFVGGEAQVARLKLTLQQWARGLFSGVYDERYARERYQIGYRHVRIGLEQKYVISAMGIVRSFLTESLVRELPPGEERTRLLMLLHKILDLDLNLMCESYMNATLENLRALNRQLEEANRSLQDASRAKDEFLGHVSHELRTPLNSILGFSKMVLDGLCSSPEEERELLRDVFSSGQHLLRLVNDLLDIRRIEEGKMRLHPADLNLRQVLDSTLPLIAVQAAEKKITLLDETVASPLPLIRADEVRLRQVLLNLLTNAVRFTPQGWVKLRAQPVPAEPIRTATGQGGWLRLEIEDTGVGIPPEAREFVFEKFAQLDHVKTSDQRGTGLGLAISRSLVEMMGGTIGVEDGRTGKGTLVWFTVPVAEPAALS